MKNVGTLTESLKDMIDKGFYYVDKTFFIKDLLTLPSKKGFVYEGRPTLDGVNLILRPSTSLILMRRVMHTSLMV